MLIDTGPVPGSLEASVVASQVDEVILTVARGEQRALAERSATHLSALGARVAGIVFNRGSQRRRGHVREAARSCHKCPKTWVHWIARKTRTPWQLDWVRSEMPLPQATRRHALGPREIDQSRNRFLGKRESGQWLQFWDIQRSGG